MAGKGEEKDRGAHQGDFLLALTFSEFSLFRTVWAEVDVEPSDEITGDFIFL